MRVVLHTELFFIQINMVAQHLLVEIKDNNENLGQEC